MANPTYIVALQCDITKERCSGFACENAFANRQGGFASYAQDAPMRFLPMTCGGCCGKGTHRRLTDFLRQIKKKKGPDRANVVVHLASCIASDNYHGPACPHKAFIRTIVKDKLGLEVREMTVISDVTERRRKEGRYQPV